MNFLKSILNKINSNFIKFGKLIWSVITYKVVLIIIMACYIIYLLNSFESYVQSKLTKYDKVYLSSLNNDSIQKVKLSIEDEFKVLENLSLMCKDNYTENNEYFTETLESNDYVGIVVLDNDLDERFSVGVKPDYNVEGFLDNVMKGKNTISKIITSETDSVNYICLGTPLYDETSEMVSGAFVCIYEAETFTNVVNASSFGKIGDIFIVEQNGKIIAGTSSVSVDDNVFNILESVDKSISKKLKKSLLNNQSGTLTYGDDNYKRYVSYDEIDDTDWYYVSLVSEKSLSSTSKHISKRAYKLIKNIVILFTVFIFVTMIIDINIYINKKSETEKEKNAR